MDLREDLKSVESQLNEARAEQARLEARIEGLVAHRDALVRRQQMADGASTAPSPKPKISLMDMYKRPAILEVLRRASRPLTATEITERLRDAGRTNEQVNTVQLYLTALFQDDMVVRPKRGLYTLAPSKSDR